MEFLIVVIFSLNAGIFIALSIMTSVYKSKGHRWLMIVLALIGIGFITAARAVMGRHWFMGNALVVYAIAAFSALVVRKLVLRKYGKP